MKKFIFRIKNLKRRFKKLKELLKDIK